MCFKLLMVTQDNDPTDPLPFVTLSACIRNVVRFLETSKENDERSQQESDRAENKKKEEAAEYVAFRIRQIERFERAARGEDRSARKRP